MSDRFVKMNQPIIAKIKQGETIDIQSQVILKQDSELDIIEQQNNRYRYTIDYLKLKLSDFRTYADETKNLSDEKMIKDNLDWMINDISNTLKALEDENV